MFRALCLSLLLLALPAAAQNACLAGQWQYDADASDNPERVLKKLLRKQKMKLRQQYKHKGEQPPEENDKAVWREGLPAFVFSTDNLTLQLDGDSASSEQGKLQREWDLSGRAKPVSLNQLASSGFTRIAGWQGGAMAVETTLTNGQYVSELWRISKKQQLQIDLLIRDTLGKEFKLSKFYRRLSSVDGCR